MDRPHYHPCYSDCPDGLLAGAPERHTPGAGWARAKAELGDMVPDLTEEDERHLDGLLGGLPARRHHMTTSARWTLARFLVESHRYVRPMPWWRFLPAALAKWPAFNRQQKADRIAVANATGAQWRNTDTTGGTDAV